MEELEDKVQLLTEEVVTLTEDRESLELNIAERGDHVESLEADLNKYIERLSQLLLQQLQVHGEFISRFFIFPGILKYI